MDCRRLWQNMLCALCWKALSSGSAFSVFLLLWVIPKKVPLVFFPNFIREFYGKGWTHVVSERWCLDLDILPPSFQDMFGGRELRKLHFFFQITPQNSHLSTMPCSRNANNSYQDNTLPQTINIPTPFHPFSTRNTSTNPHNTTKSL